MSDKPVATSVPEYIDLVGTTFQPLSLTPTSPRSATVICRWRYCRRTYTDTRKLWAHVQLNHFFKCGWDGCKQVCTSELEYRSHMFSHTILICFICRKVVDYNAHFQKHNPGYASDPFFNDKIEIWNEEHGVVSRTCRWNDCEFTGKENEPTTLGEHIKYTHGGQFPTVCHWFSCSLNCYSKIDLMHHVYYEHLFPSDSCCFLCGVQHSSLAELNVHLKDNHVRDFEEADSNPTMLWSSMFKSPRVSPRMSRSPNVSPGVSPRKGLSHSPTGVAVQKRPRRDDSTSSGSGRE